MFSILLGNMAKNRMSGSLGTQSVFLNGCTILHFHHKQMRIPVFSYLCQHLVQSILLSLKYYLIMSLNCISLVTDGVECLFVYLLVIGISFVQCLFRSFAQFSIGLFVVLLMLYNSSSGTCIVTIFLQFGLPFNFLYEVY